MSQAQKLKGRNSNEMHFNVNETSSKTECKENIIIVIKIMLKFMLAKKKHSPNLNKNTEFPFTTAFCIISS